MSKKISPEQVAAAAAKLHPVFDKMAIYQHKESETRGGIVLPEVSQGKTARGHVVAAGPGSRRSDGTHNKPPAPIGSELLFTHYSGTEVEVDGVSFLIIGEGDILAFIQ
jgi:chaperonin GroES